MPRLLTANGEKNFVGAAPTLIQELGQKLRGGNVAVFAGAQFSVGAGLPGWYELVREIARQVDYQLPPEEYTLSDHLIDAVQAFVGRRGLHSLLGLLKDRFDTTGKLPCTASQILARLPINLVFTTNLDDMLERSFREANRRVEAVVEDASLAFAPHDPDIVTIVKLGGDLAQPSSIVLARQQFDTFFQTRRRMIEFVKTELERSDMLCLGWSLPDPYFRLVFGDLLGLPGEFARPKYALVTQVSESQRRELERKGVYLIKIPPGDHGEYLTHWLSELAEAAKS